MRFEKWQACGNDFIITEGSGLRQVAARICDRHYGIGADGILEIHKKTGNDCEMVVVNADGSLAEMCGNGIRCVGEYLSEKLGREELKIWTGAGQKVVRIEKPREVIEVAMGKAELEWHREIELPGAVDKRRRTYSNATFVKVGNPHCVLIVSEEETRQGAVERFGPKIERMSDLFPEGVNVEFVVVQSRERMRVKVWERGSGRTLACGTGACASAYAAHAQGLVGSEVRVELDGGEVGVEIGGEQVKLKGPAERVYVGEI